MQTLIYNAYQSHQLFEAHQILSDAERCSSYTSYQDYKQKLPSFRSFCRDAVKCLASATPLPVIFADPPPAEEGGGENITNSTSLSFRYKKREQFNSNPTLKQLRLSKAHKYLLVPIEGENVQLSCVMCCTLNHDSENAEHSRKGFQTRYMQVHGTALSYPPLER
ncbi:hypothetical protein L916_10835 [Phytophthora nicotianae]|uniref:Uncharacterized protein n=1 Tax=Phytophthora nicotianae TaxID=4792 RepID=W2IVB2_PHYNI|nr:hypothetical protein L916_10835 [Phytophthora nicotianae]